MSFQIGSHIVKSHFRTTSSGNSGFLVDTNVVSELAKQKPDPGVVDFLNRNDELWFSVIVLHALEFGINTLPIGKRRDRISATMNEFVNQYSDRLLPMGQSEATQAAHYRIRVKREGRVLDFGDALIAGTAKVNSLVVVTQNVRDFIDLDLQVVNPFTQ